MALPPSLKHLSVLFYVSPTFHCHCPGRTFVRSFSSFGWAVTLTMARCEQLRLKVKIVGAMEAKWQPSWPRIQCVQMRLHWKKVSNFRPASKEHDSFVPFFNGVVEKRHRHCCCCCCCCWGVFHYFLDDNYRQTDSQPKHRKKTKRKKPILTVRHEWCCGAFLHLHCICC